MGERNVPRTIDLRPGNTQRTRSGQAIVGGRAIQRCETGQEHRLIAASADDRRRVLNGASRITKKPECDTIPVRKLVTE